LQSDEPVHPAIRNLVFVLALVAVLLVGWWLGRRSADLELPAPPAAETPAEEPAEPGEPEEEPEDRLTLKAVSFTDLPGWSETAPGDFLRAFRRSCGALTKLPESRPLGAGSAEIGGTAGDWRATCRAAGRVGSGDEAVRGFVEEQFVPFQVTNGGEAQGLFTGYYEPTLHGSRTRGGDYQVPLYLKPGDMVTVDLGQFKDDLEGRKITGRVAGGTFKPYHDRTAIDRGALRGQGLELVWVDSVVDAFFLEIQGSGLVELDDGERMRVGYAGQNGHPYYAIGRELIERGALTKDTVSMQSIRRWLESHPDEGREVMRTNASYVFFRELSQGGPLGSQGVVLTPGHSLAVDRSFLPMGAPVWLETTVPVGERDSGEEEPLRRLMVAQDTGGAIKGPVRGDVFWGPGDDAAERAGRMSQEGRLWILLPKAVAKKVPSGYLAPEDGGSSAPAG
jgi:membrane-bound lytic murein transglycosylase A